MTASLFLKADPIPGESIYGYLTRMGRMLGYQSPAWIYDKFPDDFPSTTTTHLLTAPDLTFLAEELGISPIALDTMRFPKQHAGSYALRGQMITRRDIYTTEEYFCPLCVREHGTHHLAWYLAFVTVCPVHNCRLISRCTACHRPVNMEMASKRICTRCSADIRVEFLDSDRLCTIVKRLLSLVGGITGKDNQAEMPEILRGLSLSAALDLIIGAGRAVDSSPKAGRNSVRNAMEHRLLGGFDVCENWRETVPKILDREADRPRSSKTLKFGSFHKRFIRNKAPNVRLLSVAAAMEHEKARLKAGSGDHKAVNIDEYEELGVTARSLGLSRLTLLRVKEPHRGRFPRIKWKKTVFLHKTEVEWFQRNRLECISGKEVSKLLNISDRHQVQALYDNWVFPHADPALQIDHRVQAFYRPTVEAFARYLDDLPERDDFDSEIEVNWRTGRAMYMSRHNSSADFVKAITSGRLIPAGRLSGKNGLPSLIFRKNTLQVAQSMAPLSRSSRCHKNARREDLSA